MYIEWNTLIKNKTKIITDHILCLFYPVESRSRRMKRRIDEFGQMIEATTDRNPLDFNGYGNWCGLGGDGIPVDEIDR